ncbi:MAG: hypothetical protein IH867_01880 [Chloroflexi bacterium]|nr:hypothetical protein [Chloroflexota bacterium]
MIQMVIFWILAGPFWVVLYLTGFRDPKEWDSVDTTVNSGMLPSRDKSKPLSFSYVTVLIGVSIFGGFWIGIPYLSVLILPFAVWFLPKGGFKDGVIVWGAYLIAAGFFSWTNSDDKRFHPWWQRPVYLNPGVATSSAIVGIVMIVLAIQFLPLGTN